MRIETRDQELRVLADALAESLQHLGSCEFKKSKLDKSKACSCHIHTRQDQALHAYKTWKQKEPQLPTD